VRRKLALIGVLGAAVAAVSPAFGQWGAAPGYYGPPPGYYAPGVYQRAVPLPPDAVFDLLERAGYREFGAMAPREPYYRLQAVNRRGDLVDLVVSMFTGQVEQERILALHQRPPLRASRTVPPPRASAGAPVPPAPRAPASQGGHDPLVIY
jgi:hypothetical protein